MEVPQNIQHQLAQFQQLQQQAQAISMQKQTVELQIQESQKERFYKRNRSEIHEGSSQMKRRYY